jgi:hypothetical protein
MRLLEEELGVAMAGYVGLLNGCSSAPMMPPPPSSSSSSSAPSIGGGDVMLGGLPPRESRSSLSDLRDAEGSYRRIASDFATLIAGWSDIAESAASSPSSSSSSNGGKDDGVDDGAGSVVVVVDDDDDDDAVVVAVPAEEGAAAAGGPRNNGHRIARYEDAASRAQRHLESFEALHRNRVDAVLAASAAAEEEAYDESSAPGGGGPGDVLGRITSLFGGIFSSTAGGGGRGGPDDDDAFFRSRERTDGSLPPPSSSSSSGAAAVPGGGGGLADFRDSVVSGGDGEDLRLITLLYERVLLANHSSYRLGAGDRAKRRSTDRSNRLLKRWILMYCPPSTTSSGSTAAAAKAADRATTARAGPNLRDDDDGSSVARRIFHAVIRMNADRHTAGGMRSAEVWLGRMRSLGESGAECCAPDAESHNIVLLGYCHLCKSFHHDRPSFSSRTPAAREDTKARKEEMSTRRFVVDGVVRVLSEWAANADGEEEEEGGGRGPNVTSLNLALNAIAKAGGGLPDDTICHSTNKLVFDLVGEEEYRRLVDPDASPSDLDEFDPDKIDKLILDHIGEEKYRKLVVPDVAPSDPNKSDPDLAPTIRKTGPSKRITPNLDTYHWLVDIYSNGASIVYTKRAMAILNKMIRIRSEQDAEYLTGDGKSRNAPASFAPSTGTHNKVLHALVEKLDESIVENAQVREETAKEATRLLDSMVLHGSSLPSPITFLFLLRLWQNTQSPEAGEYAEILLSRMEILGLYQNELRVLSNAYLQALECWLTAAKAGRPGAAERAFRCGHVHHS